jgi:hypothetical protein
MKEDLENMQRLLEQATADGKTPVGMLDAESASLREAWLAFGELLEAAQPPAGAVVQLPHQLEQEGQGSRRSPLLPGAGQRVRAVRRPNQLRRWLLPVGGLLAASLLIAVAMAWMLRDANRQEVAAPALLRTEPVIAAASTSPSPTNASPSPSAVATWDDSLDAQVTQLGQRVASAKVNQFASTDDFASMQYRIERLRQEVQADPL